MSKRLSPEISAIRKMRLEPGDIIVVEVKSILSDLAAVRLKESIMAALPENVRGLILSAGMQMKILDASGIEK